MAVADVPQLLDSLEGILRSLVPLGSHAVITLDEAQTLGPLPADEVPAYIQHRLAVAGGSNAVSFEPEAARMVAEVAHGLPRRINVLCDRALQEGRLEGATIITPE